MAKVRWVQFRNYSGIKISGTERVPVPRNEMHMDRAFWLTSCQEAPYFGSVQSYDGAAMSGGPLHNIAVYPKGLGQASLFNLLRYLEVAVKGSEALQALWDAYADVGWFVARDGRLRNIETGKEISGKAIRDEFTPIGGKVPKTGSQRQAAERWALLHHNLLADPLTFDAQKEFAIEWLLKGAHITEKIFYEDQGFNPTTLRVWGDDDWDESLPDIPLEVQGNYLSLAEDLAMCTYHSHSVNAPNIARKILDSVLKRYTRGEDFARLLIWSLGTKKFARWKDTTDGKNRYDHTRVNARKSGLWPRRFFDGPEALMPKDLPGRRPV